ncbi:MAG TPA: DUF1554 domain-containing protein [Polyangiaceae bacterium]|nr:DUF1554 domain-containing protein [Polyangiaceae bacterium]
MTQWKVSAWLGAAICSSVLAVGCGGDEFSGGSGGQAGANTAGQGGSAGQGGAAAGAAGQGGAGGDLLVFVTTRKLKGDLGGPTGADGVCNEAAQSAKVPGTFSAWISSKASSAAVRLTSNGPWRLRDGRVVADSKSELVSGTLQNAINTHEDGALLSGTTQVWTGTRVDGQPAAASCSDWTSASDLDKGLAGEAKSKDPPWTESGSILPCSGERRLYCFQK